jgi:hypothetical protein
LVYWRKHSYCSYAILSLTWEEEDDQNFSKFYEMVRKALRAAIKRSSIVESNSARMVYNISG